VAKKHGVKMFKPIFCSTQTQPVVKAIEKEDCEGSRDLETSTLSIEQTKLFVTEFDRLIRGVSFPELLIDSISNDVARAVRKEKERVTFSVILYEGCEKAIQECYKKALRVAQCYAQQPIATPEIDLKIDIDGMIYAVIRLYEKDIPDRQKIACMLEMSVDNISLSLNDFEAQGKDIDLISEHLNCILELRGENSNASDTKIIKSLWALLGAI
jgi:hypothetical protein